MTFARSVYATGNLGAHKRPFAKAFGIASFKMLPVPMGPSPKSVKARRVLERKNIYAKLCDDLAQQRFAILDGFCGKERALLMRKEVMALEAQGAFAKAKIGRGAQKKAMHEIRSDSICWLLPRALDDDFEKTPYIAQHFPRRLRTLKRCLSRRLFMSLSKIECMATLYLPGSFYRPHIDRFEGSHARVVSFVYFLNPDWVEKDGGALRLNLEEKPLILEPHLDRLVLFESEGLEHEVLKTRVERRALTGWFSVRAS